MNKNKYYLIEKIITAVLLVILLPVLIGVALVVFLETGSNPIFIQKRGLTLKKKFSLYKFRTLKNAVHSENEIEIFNKTGSFCQVLITGRILRKTGLDELPQLLNIIKGEMSFIGPRPLSLEDLQIIKKTSPLLYVKRESISIKPGITGYWQVFGIRNLGTSNLIKMDYFYYKNVSLFLNLKILLRTVKVIVLGIHSDSLNANCIYSEHKKSFASL